MGFKYHLIMRKILTFFGFLFLLISCNDTVVSEPKNLIDEDKMTNIIYDLALLEGIKSYNSSEFQSLKVNDYIYKKYKIDSLQFAKSTQFYASDVNKYQKMYEEVGKRIETNKAHIDSLLSKGTKLKVVPSLERGNLDKPMVK